jgi:hypothetical protein
MTRDASGFNIEVIMKENSKANQIAKFIMAFPNLTQAEIAKEFGVSRQRIEQVYKKCLTEAQKAERESAKEQEALEVVLPLVKSNTPKSVISALTGYSLNRIDLIFTHPLISEIIEKRVKEKNEEIEKLSIDWLAGMSLSEMKTKYGWEWDVGNCSGYISRLRKQFPEKFPIRLHNQKDLQEQFNNYHQMKNNGKSIAEIAIALGYKNVGSMKSAFYILNKNHESNRT